MTGMSAKLAGINIVLIIGLAAVYSYGQRSEIMANWPKRRCEPGIVASAGLYQPSDDKRSTAEFTQENFQFCQGQLAAQALDLAATPVKFLQEQQKNVVNTITSNVNAVQSIGATIAKIFNDMMESVRKRFAGTYVEISNSFALLWNAMGKIMASMTAIFLSLIGVLVTFTTMIQVAMYVIAIIVGILIALMVIFAAFLSPVSWLVFAGISLIGIILGAVVGVVASNGFCIAGETQIEMKDGSTKRLDSIIVGDELAERFGTVTATMEFLVPEKDRQPLISIHGVTMSRTHLVQHEGKAIQAGHHPNGIYATSRKNLYNLNTTSRKIPARSLLGQLVLWDWEEIPEDDELQIQRWKRWAFNALNPKLAYTDQNPKNTEAAFHGSLLVEKNGQLVPINTIIPGDMIRCSTGYTTVSGSVQLLIEKGTPVYDGMTEGAWFMDKGGRWISPKFKGEEQTILQEDMLMYHLFTEAGDFQIQDCFVRDFSEVGLEVLPQSYDFVCGR